MHCVLAMVACITLPRGVVILQHTWQVITLLLTGESLLPASYTVTSVTQYYPMSYATVLISNVMVQHMWHGVTLLPTG